MSVAYPSPIPYIILLIICLIVLSAHIAAFRSLRSIRRRRNILIYSVCALCFGLIAYQAYNVTIPPTVVSSYIADEGKQFFAGQTNELSISCLNHGPTRSTFNLVLTCINASLIVDSKQNYIQVNSTTIKIPLNLQGWENVTKIVYFKPNENVSAFEFNPFIQGRVYTYWNEEAVGVWNSTANSYILTIIPGPVPMAMATRT